MDIQELKQLYLERFQTVKDYREIEAALCDQKLPYRDEMRRMLCDELLTELSVGIVAYDSRFQDDPVYKMFIRNVKLLKEGSGEMMKAVAAFYQGEKDRIFPHISAFMDNSMEQYRRNASGGEVFFDETSFLDCFIVPFKRAYDGFWEEIGSLLKKYPCEKGIVELCSLIENFYDCKTGAEAEEILLDFLQDWPDFVTPKELLAHTYYEENKWNNALAWLEQVEESALFFPAASLYWMMAWCHQKLREYKAAEEYYRKVLEVDSDILFAKNNLGYMLYRQRKYEEAKKVFETCLKKRHDLPLAANNYVNVLIALGMNKEAKAFVKQTDIKLSSAIRKRVEQLNDKNRTCATDILPEADDARQTSEKTIDLGVKKQQFSSEKLLEDELELRINNGIPVFGHELKMYRRKGIYGRQFILPNKKRLDLLCEDKSGALFVIELKKDGGYDDAYAQTAEYLDWFAKSNEFGDKKVYGIICVNNPSKALVDKVHADPRMELYEYSISYTKL